jgi:hypothetical protein
MMCRHCGGSVSRSVIDLGTAPPSNAYLQRADLSAPERWYPLRVLVCEKCWLVQTEDYAQRDELFSANYAYFSSISVAWLDHARRYVGEMVARFNLQSDSLVVEVAANDGYLLQYVKERHIRCLGIEPTASTARACCAKGIEVIEEFFGTRLAEQLRSRDIQADLAVANNVLAHVPDINDFVSGFAILLKANGVATFEFPHLLQLIKHCQFDTVYHEHFSYLSLQVVQTIFEKQGLVIFDVVELRTHGGSLRVFAQSATTGRHAMMPAVKRILEEEQRAELASVAFCSNFQRRADCIKDDLLKFLIQAKSRGLKVCAYGAAAKGNTLINYAGIRKDLLPWVADRNSAKQGQFLPGSRIPVVEEERIRSERPDIVWILPWNLREELVSQLSYIREWNGKFLFAIPALEVA